MKTLNIPLEDSDYEKLIKFKKENKVTWRELVLSVLEDEE